MQLNHLHLHVESVDRAADFYTGHFGFRRRVMHGDVAFLRDAGGLDLALAPGPADNFPPWSHFGFRLDDAEAVRALFGRLEAAGAAILHPLDEEEPDFVWFRCADPDGHQIEVYWEP